MKLLRLIFAVAAASLTLQVVPALAHGTKKDNDISVYIHIDPNDKPVAGKTSTIYFFVTDKDNKYTDNDCNCRIKIEKDGKVLYNRVIHKKEYLGDPTSVAVKYVFPQLGTYTVSIDGQPKKPEQFQAFNLSYPIKVTTGNPVSMVSAGLIGLGSGLAIIIVATISIFRARKNKQKSLVQNTV